MFRNCSGALTRSPRLYDMNFYWFVIHVHQSAPLLLCRNKSPNFILVAIDTQSMSKAFSPVHTLERHSEL